MPISFAEVNSMPDILSTGRFTVFFADLPNNGGQGRSLSLSNVEVTLVTYDVAQVIVKMMGWSTAFAGRRVQANTFNMSFVETVRGNVHRQLLKWQDAAAGIRRAGGFMKTDYASEINIQVYDTTGKVSLSFNAINAWPMQVTPTQLQDDGSTPAHVECTFSVDAVDLEGVGEDETGTFYSPNGNVRKSKYPMQRSMQAMPFDLGLPPEIRMSAQTSISLMNTFLSLPISGGNLAQGRNVEGGLGLALGIRN